MVDTPSGPAEPTPTPVPPDRYRWVRRVVILALVAGALALFWVSRPGEDPEVSLRSDDPALVARSPEAGDRVLRQSGVGAELDPGYDGRLSINSRAIPEAQLDGAIPSSSPEFNSDLGVRPNAKNKVFFTPGEGRVYEKLPPGEVTVTLTFWRIEEGPEAARQISWAFSVT